MEYLVTSAAEKDGVVGGGNDFLRLMDVNAIR